MSAEKWRKQTSGCCFQSEELQIQRDNVNFSQCTLSSPETYTLVTTGVVSLPVCVVLQNRHKDKGQTNCRNNKADFKSQFLVM